MDGFHHLSRRHGVADGLDVQTGLLQLLRQAVIGPVSDGHHDRTARQPFLLSLLVLDHHALFVDGHDLGQIEDALARVPAVPGSPTAIIAHTVKGKGVSFMENQIAWHYRSPNADELAQALAELEASP